MKNTLSVMLLLGILTVFSNFTMAKNCVNCQIRSLGSGEYYKRICQKDCVFVAVTGDLSGPDIPEGACNTVVDPDWRFVLDTSTQQGQQTYAMLLAAYSANRQISIGGAQQCTMYSKGEDIDYVFFPFN